MEKVTFRRWDASEHLATEEDIAGYFQAVCEEGDPATIAVALGNIAHARSMSQLARDAGMTREALYEALSLARSPSMRTVATVAKALGLDLALAEEKPDLHERRVVVGGRAGDQPAGVDFSFVDRTLDLEAILDETAASKAAGVIEQSGPCQEGFDRVETVRDTVRKTEVDLDQMPSSPTGLLPGAGLMGAKR